ncbi:MAG: thiamine phosphate synthase, partial [Clostridium sp.]
VGVSVHSLEEAIYADENGADFILVSHIFATKCKEGLKPKGVDYIKEVKAKVSCKVVALGGINTENYNEVIKAGADGIAIMSLLFESKNIHETIKKINM